MGWLKNRLRAWLEVPPPPGADLVAGLAFRLNQVIFDAKAEVYTLSSEVRAEAEKARREGAELMQEVRRTKGAMHVAAASSEHAMYDMQLALQKVDALAEALGVVVSPPPRGAASTDVVVASTRGRMFPRAEKVVQATLELNAIRGMRLVAERTLKDIEQAEKELKRRLQQQGR